MDRIDAELLMVDHDFIPGALEGRLSAVREPTPGVPEPDMGQHMNARLLGSAIGDGQPQEDVLGARLGILDIDVEIAVRLEDAGIDDLAFGLLLSPSPLLLH